jgi:hypothetical protein
MEEQATTRGRSSHPSENIRKILTALDETIVPCDNCRTTPASVLRTRPGQPAQVVCRVCAADIRTGGAR